MGLRQVLRHKGESETSHRGIENLKDAVEDELAFDTNLEFAAAFLEFPRVEPAIGWKTQIYASVTDQVLRSLDW